MMNYVNEVRRGRIIVPADGARPLPRISVLESGYSECRNDGRPLKTHRLPNWNLGPFSHFLALGNHSFCSKYIRLQLGLQ
jgi:hypothetical protein